MIYLWIFSTLFAAAVLGRAIESGDHWYFIGLNGTAMAYSAAKWVAAE